MFELNLCKCEKCSKLALSYFDENGELVKDFDLHTKQNNSDFGFCLEHHPEKEKISAQIKKYISQHEKIVGLNASEISFCGDDLNNKKFFCCNFSNCTLKNIHSNGLTMRMCNLDFCTCTDCDFISSNIQFSNFSGSKLVHVILTGSDLIHNNFNGITAYQTSFDDSDLYNSRFIKSVLITVSMNNCNLKKTVFYESMKDNVSFKLSNTREALMNRFEGSFISDIRNSATSNEGDLKL